MQKKNTYKEVESTTSLKLHFYQWGYAGKLQNQEQYLEDSSLLC